jgi:hypothetical protein
MPGGCGEKDEPLDPALLRGGKPAPELLPLLVGVPEAAGLVLGKACGEETVRGR